MPETRKENQKKDDAQGGEPSSFENGEILPLTNIRTILAEAGYHEDQVGLYEELIMQEDCVVVIVTGNVSGAVSSAFIPLFEQATQAEKIVCIVARNTPERTDGSGSLNYEIHNNLRKAGAILIKKSNAHHQDELAQEIQRWINEGITRDDLRQKVIDTYA
jgi:L-asparaginase/Glu-tRNA(Gln) amidotransferase subunit D